MLGHSASKMVTRILQNKFRGVIDNRCWIDMILKSGQKQEKNGYQPWINSHSLPVQYHFISSVTLCLNRPGPRIINETFGQIGVLLI